MEGKEENLVKRSTERIFVPFPPLGKKKETRWNTTGGGEKNQIAVFSGEEGG